MAANSGNYTRSGNPAAMFDEEKRYLAPLQQAAKAAVDADFNDGAYSLVHQLRRVIQNSFGNGSPNNGFKIAQATSTSNNFKITGGSGTDDGAGRLFQDGLPAALKSDVDYAGAYDARMRLVTPQVTAVTTTVLTDSAASWTVNEHAGKTLTPNIEFPGTTFTILSNTATAITVTAGDLTTATSIRKHYRIELSTPSAPRTDEVFLDLFLDEVDELEDTNFVHTDLIPPQAAANRLALRQFVRVREGLTTPANYVDADGRQHYLVLIATLTRPVAAAILTANIADERSLFTAGVPRLTVKEQDGTPTVNNVRSIQVPNGALTDLGSGDVFIEAGGGGAAVGTLSKQVGPTEAIPTVTTPTPGLDNSFTIDEFPDGSTTGHRFEFPVPDDYDSGDMSFKLLYRMSTAVGGPNNVVRIEVTAEIAVNGAALDTTSYPATESDVTTPITTDLAETTVLTVAEGDFSAGDSIVVLFKRLGAHANDDHTGSLKAFGYVASYTGQVATRALTSAILATEATDEVSAAPGTKGSFSTVDFSPTVDNEEKFDFPITTNWDGVSDVHIRLLYAMSTSEASKVVKIETDVEVAEVGGSITSLGVVAYDLSVGNDTNVYKTTVLRAIPATALSPGDRVVVKLARRASLAGDTHNTGNFQLLSAIVTSGQTPNGTFTDTTRQAFYMPYPTFRVVTGTPSTNVDAPTFSGFDETLAYVAASGASGERADISWQGRIDTDQNEIVSIKVGIRGSGTTPTYRLKVYVESAGPAWTTAYDSGSLAAPVTLTETTVLAADLSAQPSGSKRYHVVVECSVDITERVNVTFPYVKQE
jgi:hypothetical protein